MPFQGKTIRAQAVVGGMTVSVRQELSKVLATDGTLHLVSMIKRTDQKAEKITAPDQELPGKQLREKGDEFFHHCHIWVQKYTNIPYLCKKV
jgi:hypothetical protein